MKRGGSSSEDGGLGGDNMMSVWEANGHKPRIGAPVCRPNCRLAIRALCAEVSASLGAHVTRLLVENETDPGLLAYGYPRQCARPATASCHARRSTRQSCGPTTKKAKQPPVSRTSSEWHRLCASVEITPLLKEEVFDDTSRFAALSACCLERHKTN